MQQVTEASSNCNMAACPGPVPILTELLGQGVVQVLKDAQGSDWFCALEADWQGAGVQPNIRPS